jgi:GNAT superfamily N-acetyltransferase
MHQERSGNNHVLTPAEAEALAFLLPLSYDYPGIDAWFLEKVVPGLRQESRLLLPVHRDGILVGLGIAKLEAEERKICTVRVAPGYQGEGIGVRLFDGLLHWLGTDQPHLTVSEKNAPLYGSLFGRYGFRQTSAKMGIYLPRVVEFSYNEPRTESSSFVR